MECITGGKKMGLIKRYFAGGNTSIGFYSLLDEADKGLDYLYILKGGSRTGKSSFMREIGNKLFDRGYDLQFYHCSIDPESLKGIVVPKMKIGIVDGTAPNTIDPKYPGVRDEIINLDAYLDSEKLKRHKKQIIKLTDDISKNYKYAYEQFAEAKLLHDEWEKIYIAAMDFNKANQVTDHLSDQIFHRKIEKEEVPTVRKLFFGAATPEGSIHFIENLTENISKRYIIKGRPGSGKSTLMKKIGLFAESKGVSVEYYPCGFDPNSLDMVIIPALDVTIVDGTAPHVINPDRENDEVVDMFQLCIDPQVEQEKEKELENIESRYKIKMTIGTNYLKEAKRLHDQLEEFYTAATDFNEINEKRDELFDQILLTEAANLS